MRILHLFSNWKWTGPAEPALNLGWTQGSDEGGGHEVLFASGRPPPGEESRITPHAESRGVTVHEGLHLTKHGHIRKNREDAAALARLLGDWRPDIVHAHMPNDHRVASLAVARTGIAKLVRTSYEPEGLSGSMRTRRVARRALDGLIVTSQTGYAGTLSRYGGSASSVSVGGFPRPLKLIEAGIDLSRFDPSNHERHTARAKLGLQPDQVAFGIVARVQGHRRFDLLLDAFAAVARDHPQVRLVVIGRGTNIKPLLLDPVKAMGLSDQVLTTGYLRGDEFPEALCALDASLFLVPGTDGTCRALREQMAMGLPSIVTPRAPLPDIVEEGLSGVVVEESSAGLESGLRRLVEEPAMRRRLAEGARDAARRRFDLVTQARTVESFYEVVLAGLEEAPAETRAQA